MSKKSPHLDPVWLRQKYEVEGLSTYDIAIIVGRDPKRVYEKLRDFGIPTRPRGHNLAASNDLATTDNYMLRPGAINPWAGRHHSEDTKRLLSIRASHPKPYLRGRRNGMYGHTGASNPRYIDGSSPERQRLYASGLWKKTVRTVYARDNYRCVRCGTGKKGWRGLHAHHLRSWAGNPELRFDPANIVTLCRTCHEWVHSTANVSGELLE